MSLGLKENDRRPQSLEQVGQRRQVLAGEESLISDREKRQYHKWKTFLQTDEERLYFLSLPSFEARERWIQSSGISLRPTQFGETDLLMIESGDVTLGMTKRAVRESWGEPDLREVAGNPVYGNERWIYRNQLSSANGFQRKNRVIYFESGRVAGWETR